MTIKATTGRVIVRPEPDITQVSGYEIPTDKKNKWGIVVDIGKPQDDIFTFVEKVYYFITGKHPCPYKIGDRVLLPSLSGKLFEYEGEPCYIFWQSEIELYEEAEKEG